MTRPDGTIVRLASGEWMRLIIFIATQSLALLALGVSMLTRIAVLETKDLENQQRQIQLLSEIRDLRQDVKQLPQRP